MAWERRPKAFVLEAQRYHDAGFVPLPLVPRPLAPALRDWAMYADGMPPATFQAVLHDERLIDSELGLVLGSRHGECRLVAVVVRDPVLIPDVTAALGATPCAVRTPGRLTIFALASFDLRLRRFLRRGLEGGWEATRLTVEGRGRYVAIPPTRLPRGQPCSWVGQPLLEVEIDSLPLVTATVLDEIQAIIDGPGEPFRTLNALRADGAQAACRAAVEALFKRRWPDEAITSRVSRALREAHVRAGDAEDSSGIGELVRAWVEQERCKATPPPSAREVTRWWLAARVTLPRTRDERSRWWTRSSVAYADCQAWAEAEGYPAPSEVAWGTTLTRAGIKSAVKKMRGRSTRMRNLRLRPEALLMANRHPSERLSRHSNSPVELNTTTS